MVAPSKKLGWVGGAITVVICGVFAFLVAKVTWLAALIFLLIVVVVFILSIRDKGIGKATVDLVKRIFLGW